MTLAEKKFFTKKHYESIKGLSTPRLSELVVHSLELVSLLSFYGLKFRFKGGNSLFLILDKPERFSIDVDIATSEPKEKIKDIIDKIIGKSVFKRYETREPKTKPWLPMISFNLYFNSFYDENSFIMLDVILKESPYEGQRVKIECKEIYRSEQTVEVPTVSGIIGDKLLTIGPSTLGIPLGKNKEAQRLKHIFDISRLSKKGYEKNKVLKSFLGCFEQEKEIQNKNNININEVIEDTILFCSQTLELKDTDFTKLTPNTYAYEIAKGFKEFKSHIFSREYNLEELKKDSQEVIKILKEIKESLK